MSPTIAIGAPCRNRAWVLPEYLEALAVIDYPRKKYMFLDDSSNDMTPEILKGFSESVESCQIKLCWTDNAPGHRRGEYNADGYAHLANIRNQFVDMFLQTDADYLLSVDSDIIVPPDIIQKLLPYCDGKTIVAAAISNIPGAELDGRLPGNFMVNRGGAIIHPVEYPLQGTLEVDVTGACYLIPRGVFGAGVRYGPNWQGEDVEFCRQAREKGYRFLVNMECRPGHRMVKNDNFGTFG